MSKTHRHSIKAKFNNGIIRLNEVSESVIKMWDRKNFDFGRYRKQRIKKRIKELNKCSDTD